MKIESLYLILKPIQDCIYYWISSARKDMPHFIPLTRGLQIAENLSVINFIIYAKHGRNYLCEHFFYQEAGFDLFDTALTDWLTWGVKFPSNGRTEKAKNEINRLCVWFHEKTNRNTLAVTGCQKRFQSWADWSNLFEYQSFSFQQYNWAIKLEKWKSWKRSFTDLFRCWSPSLTSPFLQNLALERIHWGPVIKSRPCQSLLITK